ncbi:hypothetical protein ACQWKP_22875, partial [Salmonella enterica subsp. enterica serovar Infantis]
GPESISEFFRYFWGFLWWSWGWWGFFLRGCLIFCIWGVLFRLVLCWGGCFFYGGAGGISLGLLFVLWGFFFGCWFGAGGFFSGFFTPENRGRLKNKAC